MPHSTSHHRYLLLIGLVVAAVGLTGIDGVFVLDDHHNIVNNRNIRSLWPVWAPFLNTTRPLIQVSNAFNFAISGLATWSYHLLNIALHLAAALTLFGIARRILARFPATADHAPGLAAASAAIWAIHPLQTESVTYIIQRAESAMGLTIFLVLYAFLRATESPNNSRWLIVSAAACFLGYGIKPIMVVAPLLLWLFDRQFVSGTFRGAVRAHPKYYTAIFLSPLVLPLFLAGNTNEWKDSAGVGALPVTWYEYAATQPEVILHYLRLCVWPAPLCLDYGWPVERAVPVIIATSLVIAAAAAVTVWGFVKKHPVGFLGAWFIVNLAPTSSFIPIADLAFEHRVYLALASVVCAAVIGLHLIFRQRGPAWFQPALALVAVLFFAAFTVRRNRDYSSEIRLWTGNVATRPDYARARNNLGLELARAGQFDAAIVQLRRATELKPGYAIAHFNLGKAYLDAGQAGEARSQLEISRKLAPEVALTHAELGRAAQKLGDRKAAVAHFANAARLNQGEVEPWMQFASALIDLEQYAQAVKVLDQAILSHADSPRLLTSLAVILAASPDDRVRAPQRAQALARQAVVATQGQDFEALDALGMTQAESGEYESAIKAAEAAIGQAREQGAKPEMVHSMEARVASYRSGKPWRLSSPAVP